MHWLGKVKTVMQLVAIPMLLYDASLLGIDCRFVGTVLVYLAAILTVWSMLYYLRQAWPFLRDSI